MNNEDLAWAAGLFDGEGCFFINTVRKNGKEYKYLCATLKMCNEKIVRKFAQVIGLGTIWSKKPKQTHYLLPWEWRTHGLENTRKVAFVLWPWLSEMRQNQFQALVAQLAEAPISRIG